LFKFIPYIFHILLHIVGILGIIFCLVFVSSVMFFLKDVGHADEQHDSLSRDRRLS